VQALSDAAAHFACLKDHPRRKQLQGAFLGRFGHDGDQPGGVRVVTTSPDTRAAFGAAGGSVALIHAPLLVSLEMPAPTAAEWKASDFWRCLRGAASAAFAGKGFAVHFRCQYGLGKVSFAQCPHGWTPADAPAGTVRRSVRLATAEGALRLATELAAALAAAV
jgi:hypothetical protein